MVTLDKSTQNLFENVDGKDKAPGNEDNHYQGNIQPIDFIEDQQLGFHEANIIKYTSRWKKKGQLEDLYKVAWYLNRLIKFVETEGVKIYIGQYRYQELLAKEKFFDSIDPKDRVNLTIDTDH